MFNVKAPIHVNARLVHVPIQFTENKEQELLDNGRIGDALNLLNQLEQIINDKNGILHIDLSSLTIWIKNMRSFDPNNNW